MLQIIIADDHEIVRCGLTTIINQQASMTVNAGASSFNELTTLLGQNVYDILILDLNLGDKNGLESIEIINNLFPKLPILVFSSYPEDPYALQAFKAGASGYLNKAVIAQELIPAIQKVVQGKKHISTSLKKTLLFGTNLEKQEDAMTASLSRRELEVLSAIAEGKSYKEIAVDLNISPKTVSTYRTRILEKLNFSNTAELLRFAYEHDIAAF